VVSVATLSQGRPHPLGATLRDGGINVAVFSSVAHRVELCLFDETGAHEVAKFALHGPTDGVFHAFVPGARSGLVYGFRVHGPHAPHEGSRCNPHKLLLDPYAREIVGSFDHGAAHHGEEASGAMSRVDNASTALKARVPGKPEGPCPRDNAPRHASNDLVLYEVHVKGFGKRLPGVPEALQGTYAGLAHPQAIAHFKRLGLTTLSLLPVHHALDELHLHQQGRVNHWGYNTIGFFALQPRHAADPARAIDEFRAMVHTLHAHGLEVVIDVVYNHSAEGDERGPTIAFRGLDNAAYYRLPAGARDRYDNFSGCGNTLNVSHPRVTQLVMDSLRYWVEVMGVDGFRFDLASILGRGRDGVFDPSAAFFTALRQDPVLSQVHLIAEPWDVAAGGYQVGGFPSPFIEWNDRFRDTVRAFWLGQGVTRGEFVRRFMASSDLFHHSGRRPSASVNFIAAHDGFTLADMVRYGGKRNHANGENNRDGRSDELCNPMGPEGPSDDPAVNARRTHVQRAMLATLLLAHGTPMLNMGDELGHSQGGNNNAYCQDNAITRLDWAHADQDLLAWTAQLIALRRDGAGMHADAWYVDAGDTPSNGAPCVAWLEPDGQTLHGDAWHDPQHKAFAAQLSTGWFFAFNASAHPVRFARPLGAWHVVAQSAPAAAVPHPSSVDSEWVVEASSIVVLRAQA
jgi:isoamylase